MERMPYSVPDMHSAASLGEQKRVQELLERAPEAVHAVDSDLRTPLHLAVWGGYREIVERLLSAGAEVDARDRDGRTPLMHMVPWCTRPDMVTLLLEHGADLNARDESGNTALYLAASCIRRDGHCWGDHARLTQFLLEQNAEIDLFTAALLNRTEDAASLLDAAPERIYLRDRIVARDRRGWNTVDGATALHRAADAGHLEMTELLLKAGAEVDALDSRGRRPLMLAAHEAGPRKQAPSPAVAELLLQSGARNDIFANAILGRTDAVNGLLAADGSLVQVRAPGEQTPLHLAAWNGKLPMVELLLRSGADPNVQDLRGQTPLDIAGNAEVAQRLLDAGAVCSLFNAIVLKRTATIEALVRTDPGTLRRRNRRGRTPLRVAAEALLFGDTAKREIVALLLACGAPMDLWTAATLGDVAEVERLLQSDTLGINAFDNTVTALHCAANQGHLAIVERLVENGAALDPVAQDLCTPTIWALWSGHQEVARYLVSQGANVNAMDNWAMKPWIADALQ